MVLKTKFCVVDIDALAGVRNEANSLSFIFKSGWAEKNRYNVADERDEDFGLISESMRKNGGVVIKDMVIMPGELAAVGMNEAGSLFPVFLSGARHEMKYVSEEECAADYIKLEAGMCGLKAV